ncbi:MAG: nitroreductase [Phycisphaeraceae bacterium]|nr:nitroreductase [Phycisphaeraceae bacterium]MCW5755451.1 nitroreductase [Phycisphaeraceae bacterium]
MTPDDRAAVLAFLASRRSASLSALGPPGPDEPQIARLMQIAARVPDHGALTPWRFVLVQGAALKRFGDLVVSAIRLEQPHASHDLLDEARLRATQAPLAVTAVFSPRPHAKIPEWEQLLSAGAACMNLLSAATAMGFGAVWLTPRYTRSPLMHDAFTLTHDERIVGIIFIGSHSTPREDRPRPALEAVVTRLASLA